MIAAQPWAFSIAAQRVEVVLRAVAAGIEQRGRERARAGGLQRCGRRARAWPRARPGSMRGDGPALVAGERVAAERQRRDGEAGRDAGPITAACRARARQPAKCAFSRSSRLGRPARRRGHRDPGVDIVLRARSSGRGRSAPRGRSPCRAASWRKVTTGYQRSSGETSGPRGALHPVGLAVEAMPGLKKVIGSLAYCR